MKLLIFLMDNVQAEKASNALIDAGFRVTKLASTGGWLRRGNTTLLVGIEDQEVARVLAIVRAASTGAVVFTLPLERFERL